MEIIRTFYTIQKRKFSANVVQRVDVTLNEKGKEIHHHVNIMAPLERKEIGDKHAKAYLKMLKANADKKPLYKLKMLRRTARRIP